MAFDAELLALGDLGQLPEAQLIAFRVRRAVVHLGVCARGAMTHLAADSVLIAIRIGQMLGRCSVGGHVTLQAAPIRGGILDTTGALPDLARVPAIEGSERF